ncbi:heavy metal translocating P-type ATPase, partial [Weissella sp. DD23]
CPHALGLAIPLVVARLTGIAAQQGLLIQNRPALEQVNQLRYALMDKTGTLTAGNFKVQQVLTTTDAMTADEILQTAAALEQGSTHPIATSLLQAVTGDLPTVMHQETIPGAGVTGMIGDDYFALLNMPALRERGIAHEHAMFASLADKGYTVSFLVKHDTVVGVIGLGDAIKDDARQFIADLKAQRITPVMLTGDNEAAAQVIARQLGIEQVHANLKPQDKVALVTQYQQQGGVMMIGDGVNDSPALAQADLGVAIGAGTDVAINAADVVLVHSKPSDVLTLLSLARQAKRKMTQNLWWGAGYNLIALPLAAGILMPIGIRLDPMVGAILMSLSTIVVAINAMTLRLK